MDSGFLGIAVVLVVVIVIVRLYLRDAARAKRRRSDALHRFDADGADGRQIQRIKKRNGRGFD